ncbi:MAG: isocitrate/isopropylmalate dehydrogenase family protein [Armatimonadota bacterium]
MSHTVTIIPGDGIGPEVTGAMRRCVDATGVDIDWEVQQAGADVMDEYGTPLPDQVIESIKKNKVAIKGPVTTPVGTGFRSVNVALRQKLDLYACVRPSKYYEGAKSRYPEADIVIVRENTEDLYAGIEFEFDTDECMEIINTVCELGEDADIRGDSGVSIKPISVMASKRIVRFAFDYALANDRQKVTAVHKANIMKYSDGLFLDCARQVAEEYADTDIEFEDRIVDNMCMQLVQKPELYDVLVLPNLYGDIVSDLCSGLVGGLGVAPGANIGHDCAVFEPTHGSAPKYKGQNKVNPTATLLSAVLMLRHLEEKDAADRLENAVAAVIREGENVTYDMKPTRDDPTAVGTYEMAEAIIAAIQS